MCRNRGGAKWCGLAEHVLPKCTRHLNLRLNHDLNVRDCLPKKADGQGMAAWRVIILSSLLVSTAAFSPVLRPVRIGSSKSQPAPQSILARTSILRSCEQPAEQRRPSPEPEENSPGFIILAIAVFAISYLIGDSSSLMPVDKLF
jgi:hypothetical protein